MDEFLATQKEYDKKRKARKNGKSRRRLRAKRKQYSYAAALMNL